MQLREQKQFKSLPIAFGMWRSDTLFILFSDKVYRKINWLATKDGQKNKSAKFDFHSTVYVQYNTILEDVLMFNQVENSAGGSISAKVTERFLLYKLHDLETQSL